MHSPAHDIRIVSTHRCTKRPAVAFLDITAFARRLPSVCTRLVVSRIEFWRPVV